MSALLRIFFVATLICVNPRVRKRGFSVKALQALGACTRSQREFIFPDEVQVSILLLCNLLVEI